MFILPSYANDGVVDAGKRPLLGDEIDIAAVRFGHIPAGQAQTATYDRPNPLQYSRSIIGWAMRLRLLKSVYKTQRLANPHGTYSPVYDFINLFTTLIGRNTKP